MKEVIFVVKVLVAKPADVICFEVISIFSAPWRPRIPFSIIATPAYLHIFCPDIVLQQVFPRRTVVRANFAQVVQ
jgi:hypothetical protein